MSSAERACGAIVSAAITRIIVVNASCLMYGSTPFDAPLRNKSVL